MKRPNKRQTAFVLLFVFYIYVGFCVWGIMTDYPNTFNLFYQPEKPVTLPVAIAYPPISNGQLQDEWLQVRFDLEANSTLSEGVNLSIANVQGCVYLYTFDQGRSSGYDISNVWIGFQYAQPWRSFGAGNATSQHQFTALDGDWLMLANNETAWLPMNDNPYGMGIVPLKSFMHTVFFFPSSGDYSPSMIVSLDNGTFLVGTYDQVKIHVLSNSELETLKVGRIDTAIAISLLLFAGIEGVSLTNDLTKKKHEYGYDD